MCIEREMAEYVGVMDVVAIGTPRERTLASWTLAGAISKPCGYISVAGMTELPNGTDHAELVYCTRRRQDANATAAEGALPLCLRLWESSRARAAARSRTAATACSQSDCSPGATGTDSRMSLSYSESSA